MFEVGQKVTLRHVALMKKLKQHRVFTSNHMHNFIQTELGKQDLKSFNQWRVTQRGSADLACLIEKSGQWYGISLWLRDI